MNVTISSGLFGYLFLLLTMRPVFITLCLAMSIAFYGVLMNKTALVWLLAALFLAFFGGCMGIDSLILRLFRSLQGSIAAFIHRIHVC
ncbi:TPA: hypothetical protein MG487_19340 [Klebsiella pneumoniae]|nr:hypothetical protein [Klebsiella pneumoniae]